MEEEEKKAVPRWSLGCDLGPMGLEELGDYAEALRAELERVEGAAGAKKNYLGDAAKLFKT